MFPMQSPLRCCSGSPPLRLRVRMSSVVVVTKNTFIDVPAASSFCPLPRMTRMTSLHDCQPSFERNSNRRVPQRSYGDCFRCFPCCSALYLERLCFEDLRGRSSPAGEAGRSGHSGRRARLRADRVPVSRRVPRAAHGAARSQRPDRFFRGYTLGSRFLSKRFSISWLHL